MKQIFLALSIILCANLSMSGQSNGHTDQIILALKNDNFSVDKSLPGQNITGNDKIDNITQKFPLLFTKKLIIGNESDRNLYVLRFPPGTNIQQIIDEYYNTGEIDYAEPDYRGTGGGMQGITPDDQHYSNQWSLNNDGSFSLSPSVAGADIDIQNAWEIEQGDSNVIVAIIDSGAKLNHPEFTGRIWTNFNEVPNNALDDDNNGFIDDIRGWDFAYDDNNPTDDYGHGTNIAGIIGANANNNIGFAGVDWNCKLMILKGLDVENSGYYSWWVEAIHYAVDHGARVINMSLGGTSNSTTLRNGINYALNNNVVVVVSMMNNNSDIVFYPAGFGGVIAVGSTDANDTRTNPFFWSTTSGSSYGDHISVVAPGNYIYGLNYQSNTNYSTYWGGTSQAAPHVTGLASLLLAQDPSRTAGEIKSIIEGSAEDETGDPDEDISGWDRYYGYGRINAFNALSTFTGTGSVNSKNHQISLFPNPTDGNITVIVPSGAKQIEIFNSLGETVLTNSIEGHLINNFYLKQDGTYFIRIMVDNQTITHKIIVH